MAMKKIKPQYGKVIPPTVKAQENSEILEIEPPKTESRKKVIKTNEEEREESAFAEENADETKTEAEIEKTDSRITSEPNPFLQTKEIFGKANLTKIGYRMRTEYVEILDIIKKLKKGGYTLEAVLDDALTYYFENSADGKEALEKAKLFYS